MYTASFAINRLLDRWTGYFRISWENMYIHLRFMQCTLFPKNPQNTLSTCPNALDA